MFQKNYYLSSFSKPCPQTTTYAIFSDGDRHGTSSSSSSSLSSPSPSSPSSPDTLNVDDVNMSGTGRIDGRRLPKIETKVVLHFILECITSQTHLSADSKCPGSTDLDCCSKAVPNDSPNYFPHPVLSPTSLRSTPCHSP
jgi:hypothetical protein